MSRRPGPRPLPRRVVLLTGMSGAGKSAALRGLAARGHRTADLDHGDFARLEPDPDVPVGWAQVWDLERVAALVDEHREGLLFLAGTVDNQGALYHRFDAVVLMTAPAEVLLERIAARNDNPFGKDPHGRATVLQHVAEVEPLLRRSSTDVVRTDRPLEEVVDDLERVALRGGVDPAQPRPL